MLFFSSLSPFSDNVRVPVSNEYLLAKFGFDTAENEPCKVCPLSAYRSPRSITLEQLLNQNEETTTLLLLIANALLERFDDRQKSALEGQTHLGDM